MTRHQRGMRTFFASFGQQQNSYKGRVDIFAQNTAVQAHITKPTIDTS